MEGILSFVQAHKPYFEVARAFDHPRLDTAEKLR
jgi:hypothetical protein